MRSVVWLVVLLFFARLSESKSDLINLRPIIGIMAEPDHDAKPFRSYIPGTYVDWLSAGGARVVPIPYNTDEESLFNLFQSVNGVLFTGGGLTLGSDTPYFQACKNIWNWAILTNLNGDYFPLWGTCLGFQLMSILAANDHSILLDGYDSENLSLPLYLTPEAATSRILGACPPSVLTALTQQSSTMNLHHEGVIPDTYTQNQNLQQIFKVLSTNVDRKNKIYASMIEARTLPFYATQFHPERNQFVWGLREVVDKTPEAISAMQYLADFFVTETRKNGHKFPSVEDEAESLIYNYSPVYTGNLPVSFPEEITYYFPV